MSSILNKVIVSLGLYLSILTAAQPGDMLVWRAVNAFYNYETAHAISILDSARIEYPENPLTHFTWAAAQMLHAEANYTTERTYLILSTSLNEIIPILIRLEVKYSQDPEYRLYLGCAIGLRARVSLGRKQWLSTLVNAFKGFRLIQAVARRNPELIDAQLPMGIVEYYAGLNPGFIQLGAKLMGIGANRAGGLAKIEKAAGRGEFSRIEAKKIFAFLSMWVEDDPESALDYSRDLRVEYPQNLFFGIMYLESLIRTKNYTEAKKLMNMLERELVLLSSIQQGWYKSYLQYELALYKFLHEDYTEALQNVDEAIHNYKAELDIFLGNAWLLKGMIHDRKGNREEAIQAYRACINLDNNSAAIKRGKEYLNSPFKN